MKKIGVIFFIILISGCVSLKKYRDLEEEMKAVSAVKKQFNKDIRWIENKNKLLEDSIFKWNELAKLESTKIEKRLAKKGIIVKVNLEYLKRLAVRNQDMNEAGQAYLSHYNFTDTASASKTKWLSNDERELMYWLNYARLNPEQFCMKYVYPRLKREPDDINLITLADYMLSMKPVPALMPDKKLFESALCHAETMGKAGLIGHGRQDGCKASFSGECCAYGNSSPLEIVMQLLIDSGVPSLGHRYICLGTYTKLGVSIKPHKGYGTNAVLDFGYGSI